MYRSTMCKFTTATLIAALFVHNCHAICSFPPKLLGEFVMQSTVTAGSQVQYSQVNITTDSIPIWGSCYRRIGNNVILMDISGNCFRCFHLNLRSKNVLQARTVGLDKCYTKEDAAVKNCPVEHSPERFKEILLYKTRELGGEEIRKEYCPINGHYTFTYNLNEGTENKPECPDFSSEVDNCQMTFNASALNLRFRRCSFENHDITFQCLGHWPGPSRQKYLALLDKRIGRESRAQYRCALYQEDTSTGNIYIAFSSDSTCTSDLRSATEGFETLILNPVTSSIMPIKDSPCRFPAWSQGDWEQLDIKGSTIIYKDHTIFQTSTVKCVEPSKDNSERFVIFTRDQCGMEQFTCLWIKKRDTNVLEFQFGAHSSLYFNASLCSDMFFPRNAWITQGRLDVTKESPCPIAGEYTGEIPDNKGLCAKLYSDCNNPDIMFYTIANCTESQVYEGNRMRMSNGRLPRWKRQAIQQQRPNRVFHISNPRLLLTSTLIPQTVSPIDEFHSTQNPRVENYWGGTQINPAIGLNQQGRSEDERMPKQPFLINDTLVNKPWSQRENINAEGLPLTQYDNSGYARRPVGHSGYKNPSMPYSADQPGRYAFEDRYDPNRRRYNPEYLLFNGGASNQGVFNRQPENRQATPQPSETPFSEEEYDPWAFSKIHSRRNLGNSYGQQQMERAPTWNSRQSQETRMQPMQVHNAYSTLAAPLQTPPPVVVSVGPLPTEYPSFQRRPVINNPEPSHSAPQRNNAKREEREYRCLGKWDENGLTYTYTQRRDVGSSFDFAHQFQFECFVGSITSNTEIDIQEAGEHCQRDVDPKVHQVMKLTKRSEAGSCFGGQPPALTSKVPPPHPRPTSSWYSSKRPPEPTKPWKPITAPPRSKVASGADVIHYKIGAFVMFFLLRWI